MLRRPDRAYYARHLSGLGDCSCVPPSRTSSPGLGLAGLGDDIVNLFGGSAKSIAQTVEEKATNLDRGLKIIIALSSVAALASLATWWRGRARRA